MNSILVSNNDLEDPIQPMTKRPKRNSVLTENVFSIYGAMKVFIIKGWHKLKYHFQNKFGSTTFSSEGGVGEYT